MNWITFTSLPLIALFLHANSVYAGGGFTVRYYNQQNNQILSSRDISSEAASSANQNNNQTSVNLSNEEKQVSNYAEKQNVAVSQSDNEHNPFSWMSQVGRMNQQYHNDVQNIISKIKVEKQAKNYNNTQVQTISFNSNSLTKQSNNSNRDSYDHIISNLSDKYGVSAGLVKAVMHTESSFNPNARSPVGAQGLMQLMPATARRFKVSNAYDPQQNIEGGVKYLGWLIKRFDGNLTLALAGYNAGEGNVDKYGDVPPFKETRDYVKRVLTRYHSLYRGL